MESFNAAAKIRNPNTPKSKLISLPELRAALNDVVAKSSSHLVTLHLRNPRSPKNNRLIKTWTPEQQAAHAVTRIMSRITRKMGRNLCGKLSLPYYSRPPRGEGYHPWQNPPIKESNAYVEADYLGAWDFFYDIRGAIYVQPNGSGGTYPSTYGRKIFSKEQVQKIVKNAVTQCIDYRADVNNLIHHVCSHAGVSMQSHESHHEEWAKRRQFELSGKRGPNPF